VIDLHQVKAHLQNHLSVGLVFIIGSGFFVWEDIPSMTQLAQRLIDRVPDYIQAGDEAV